ncbi:unnamed protein product [Moneuplotes crassus]|uniref:Uncharacterized protein n=2 Tax=Euplotes crassus TaxID=5936 RepID=A0AAD2D564_EUPCR|nr:unnamed protein product [Moneuplotes crassus]
MFRIFRPRTFGYLKARKFTANTNLLGRSLKGEGVKAAKNRVIGYDKMVLNKLSFFHLTGNVFTAYCVLKSIGWAQSILERKQNKIYEDQILSEVAKSKGVPISETKQFEYSEYLDQYTQELALSLPIIFLLGMYTNRRFGSVYSFKLLAASYGLGFLLRHTGFGPSGEFEGSSLNIAGALGAHTILRVGLPFPVALLLSSSLIPFTGLAGPIAGSIFAIAF